jgi:hypothetical protein
MLNSDIIQLVLSELAKDRDAGVSEVAKENPNFKQ